MERYARSHRVWNAVAQCDTLGIDHTPWTTYATIVAVALLLTMLGTII